MFYTVQLKNMVFILTYEFNKSYADVFSAIVSEKNQELEQDKLLVINNALDTVNLKVKACNSK